MNTEEIARTLASHQRAGQGITLGSPDECLCGTQVAPVELDLIEYAVHGASQRARDLAFGRHQAAMIAEAAS